MNLFVQRSSVPLEALDDAPWEVFCVVLVEAADACRPLSEVDEEGADEEDADVAVVDEGAALVSPP